MTISSVMSSKSKEGDMNINVALEEPLTSSSCVKLITELLKYILYQKQQIPFTYDSLMQLQTRVKPTDRSFSSIKALLSSLKNTSDQLTSQFHLKGCKIREIAIIVGATVISPKLHIRLELPPEILDSQEHHECKHTSRKPLVNLMRSMFESTEFQDAMTMPLSPTNTFLLLQKSDCNSVSEFFLPKPQYAPATHVTCFRIKLHHNKETNLDCNCVDLVKVYHEISESHDDRDKSVLHNNDVSVAQASYKWYQSKEVIKGFKYVR